MRTTRIILWTRGALTTVGAVGVFLMASEDFRKLVSPAQFLSAGAFFVAAQAVLGFLDRSLSQHQQGEAPTPVTIEQPADQPVPTQETP